MHSVHEFCFQFLPGLRSQIASPVRTRVCLQSFSQTSALCTILHPHELRLATEGPTCTATQLEPEPCAGK